MRRLSFLSAVLALLTLGGLGVISLVDTIDGPGTRRQEREARTPDVPKTLEDLRKFAGQAKHHVVARYAFKDLFLRLNGEWKFGLLGHPDTPSVIRGQDGFLFLASQGTIPLVQGQNLLSVEAQARWKTHFAALKEAFADESIPYALLIGPNKHSIYPDLLPSWITPAKQNRTSEVLALATAELGISAPDLRPVLVGARDTFDDADLYHPTDTHWTELGAALSIQLALKGLGVDLPAPTAEQARLPRSGDLSRMIGLQTVPGPFGPFLPRKGSCRDETGNNLDVSTIDPLMPRRFTCGTPAGRPEVVVVFTDSFGVGTIPYLAAHFARVEYIWTDEANPRQAQDLGADIVLQVLVERKLNTEEPERFLARAAR